jgi:polysaccharide transporter, PST family
MTQRRRLLDNMFSLYSLQGLNYLLPLIVTPFLVRRLGADRFGAVAFAVATMQQFVMLTDFGFNFSATRYVAIHRDDVSLVNKCFSAVMTVKMLLVGLSAVVLAVMIETIPKMHAEWRVFLVGFLMVAGNALFPSWAFQGLERMRFVAIATVLARLALIPLVFVVVHGPQDYLRAAGLQCGSYVLSAAIGFPILYRLYPIQWRWPGWRAMAEQMRESFHPFLGAAMGNLIGGSSVLFLGMFKGLDVVGGYSAMERVARAEVMGFAPMMQAVYPHVSNKFARSHAEGRSSMLKWTVLPLVLGAIGMGAVALFAKPLVHLAYGAKLSPYAPVLQWFSLWAFLALANNLLGVQYLLSSGNSKPFGWSITVSALVTVGLFLILIPRTVTGGALTAVIAGEAVQLAIGLWSIRRIERRVKASAA